MARGPIQLLPDCVCSPRARNVLSIGWFDDMGHWLWTQLNKMLSLQKIIPFFSLIYIIENCTQLLLYFEFPPEVWRNLFFLLLYKCLHHNLNFASWLWSLKYMLSKPLQKRFADLSSILWPLLNGNLIRDTCLYTHTQKHTAQNTWLVPQLLLM